MTDTVVANQANAALHARARRVIPGGTSRLHNFYRPNPIWARQGIGCRLIDADGVERLDFLNNMTALSSAKGGVMPGYWPTSAVGKGMSATVNRNRPLSQSSPRSTCLRLEKK